MEGQRLVDGRGIFLWRDCDWSMFVIVAVGQTKELAERERRIAMAARQGPVGAASQVYALSSRTIGSLQRYMPSPLARLDLFKGRAGPSDAADGPGPRPDHLRDALLHGREKVRD
eukprot:2094020-Pyramimonas_sp.AAC.1